MYRHINGNMGQRQSVRHNAQGLHLAARSTLLVSVWLIAPPPYANPVKAVSRQIGLETGSYRMASQVTRFDPFSDQLWNSDVYIATTDDFESGCSTDSCLQQSQPVFSVCLASPSLAIFVLKSSTQKSGHPSHQVMGMWRAFVCVPHLVCRDILYSSAFLTFKNS
jgi:hypothetical protein